MKPLLRNESGENLSESKNRILGGDQRSIPEIDYAEPHPFSSTRVDSTKNCATEATTSPDPDLIHSKTSTVPTEGQDEDKAEITSFQSCKIFAGLDDPVSYSCLKCASWRALESERPVEDRLFSDPLAAVLTGDIQIMRARSRFSERALARMSIRTRYFDEFLVQSIQSDPSIRQVVILGAGMDARAYRIQALRKDITLFEVDRPSVIELKEKLVAKAGNSMEPLCGSVERVKANLEEYGWEAGLVVKGFNWKEKSVWLIEGLVYYLREQEVVKMFKTIRRLSAAGSRLCFSNISKARESYVPEKCARDALKHPREEQDCVVRLSKYFRWYCSDPSAFLKDLEFKVSSVVRLGGPEANYGRWDGAPSNAVYVKFAPSH